MNSLTKLHLSVFAILLSIADLQVLPQSPCPNVLRYETDGYQYYGVISAHNPPQYDTTLVLKVTLLLPSQVLAVSGKIQLYEDSTTTIQRIKQGYPMMYRIRLPQSNPVAQIVNIIFNDRIICSGPSFSSAYFTSVQLQHTFHTAGLGNRNGQQFNNVFRPQQQQSFNDFTSIQDFNVPNTVYQQQPQQSFNDFTSIQDFNAPNTVYQQQQRPFNSFSSNQNTYRPNNVYQQQPQQSFAPTGQFNRPVQEFPQNNFLGTTQRPVIQNSGSGICGTVSSSVMLVVGGRDTEKGDWPWAVGILLKKRDETAVTYKFRCGGTLISSTKILTAAHCVTNSNGGSISSNDFLVKVGFHNVIDETEPSGVTKIPSRIRVHEDYRRPKTLANDIAIISVNDPFQFNDFVRPVCLWEGDNSQNQIYNAMATVVGWGIDESGGFSATLKAAVVPIVSTDTCKGSKKIFHDFTSNNTLCAGGKNDIGPCKGDSGSGLFMKIRNSWTIRGLVSISLGDSKGSCDLKEYFVFTDVAKYLPWIRQS